MFGNVFNRPEFKWKLASDELVLPANGQTSWSGDDLSAEEIVLAHLSSYVQLLFDEHIDEALLKTALAKTLECYPLLAARFELKPNNGLRLTEKLSGAYFCTYDVEVSPSARSLDEFYDKGGIVERMLFSIKANSAKYNRKGTLHSLSAPLLCVQVSKFSTGQCLVGISLTHALGDADSLAKVVKTLDLFCSNLDLGKPLPTYSRKKVSQAIATAADAKKIRQECVISLAPERLWFSYYRFGLNMLWNFAFSHSIKLRIDVAKLRALKSETNSTLQSKVSPSAWVSTNDLLTSMLIVALHPTDRRYVSTFFNMRGRSRYIPSTDYLGSAVCTLAIEASLFQSKGPLDLAEVALQYHAALRAAVKADRSSKMFDHTDYRMFKCGKSIPFARDFLISDHNEKSFVVNSWTQFRESFFSVRFGGKDTPTRMPFALAVRGLAQTVAEYGNGDWSVNLALSTSEKKRLLHNIDSYGWGDIMVPTN